MRHYLLLLLSCAGLWCAGGRSMAEPLLTGQLSWSESAPVSAGGGLRVGQYEQAAQLPLWLHPLPSGVLTTHLQVQQSLFTLRGNRLGERRLYRLALPVYFYEQAYGRFQTRYHLTPALYSDERVFDLRAAQVEGGFDTRIGLSRTLNLELGARTDRRYGEHRLYYLWGADWLGENGWQVHAVVPEPFIQGPLGADWQLRVGMQPAGSRWRFGTKDHSPLAYKALQQYVSVQSDVNNQLALALTLGRRLNRHLDVDGESVRPSPAPYWQLDLSAHW